MTITMALTGNTCRVHLLTLLKCFVVAVDSAFYSISRPGKYKLNVKLNDVHHIAGSPFEVEVLA